MKLVTVVQRYGEEVIGGAESLAREVCRRLSERHQVTVLTSCARDYRDWSNHYPEGESFDQGIRILRFPSARSRHWARFGYYSRLLYGLRRLSPLPRCLEEHWLRAQGPFCPGLETGLAQEAADSDLVLFFSCLYHPTVRGLPLAAGKSILVPTAHDEPALGFSIYREVFRAPAALVFLSPEERDLVNRKFDVGAIPQDIAGFGVDLPEELEPGSDDYLLYLGRIEAGKNCGELFSWARKAGVRLVAAGPAAMPVPGGIDYRGQVTEAEKRALLSGTRAVIIPSRNESLSIAALEAWAFGKPVIVSASSPVLAGQVERSRGGVSYASFLEFAEAARKADPEMGIRGREFVRRHYSWEVIIGKWEEILTGARERAAG